MRVRRSSRKTFYTILKESDRILSVWINNTKYARPAGITKTVYSIHIYKYIDSRNVFEFYILLCGRRGSSWKVIAVKNVCVAFDTRLGIGSVNWISLVGSTKI